MCVCVCVCVCVSVTTLAQSSSLPKSACKVVLNVPVGMLINPRRACAARVTVLGLCVCVSVTQHLTFHAIIRATNDTNLSGG